jgi:hypothetical protein
MRETSNEYQWLPFFNVNCVCKDIGSSWGLSTTPFSFGACSPFEDLQSSPLIVTMEFLVLQHFMRYDDDYLTRQDMFTSTRYGCKHDTISTVKLNIITNEKEVFVR